MRRNVILALSLVLSISAISASQAVQYTIHQLTALSPGQYTSATAINESGQICGCAMNSLGNYDACVWDADGTPRDLGNLAGFTSSSANAINDSGQVVGLLCTRDTSVQSAFIWDANGMRELPSLGGTISCAYGINNDGTVVGVSRQQYNQEVIPCKWDDLGAHQLNTGQTLNVGKASAINDNGVILGEYGAGSCYWDATGVHPFDTGASSCSAINNGGLVVGGCWGSSSCAYSWDANGQHALPGLSIYSCYAHGVNDLGLICGYSQSPGGGTHACLWTNGIAQDLGTLPGYDSYAYSINNQGVIVGVIRGVNTTFAVEWEPVPEPASTSVLILGMFSTGLLAFRRRR